MGLEFVSEMQYNSNYGDRSSYPLLFGFQNELPSLLSFEPEPINGYH